MRISVFIKRHPVSTYFVLTFAISWGCILLAIVGFGGIPATKEQFNAQLPVAIVAMLGGPSISGILLTGLVSGKAGFRELLSRIRRWRVSAGWYVVALLTAPLLLMATLLGLSLFSSVYLPGIFASDNKVQLLLSSIVGGVVTGICEELGWTGFAVPRLRLRYSILATGLIVGVLWGAWHILSNDVWGSSTYAGSLSIPVFLTVNGLCFLAGQLPAFRVLTVLVYDRTDSLLVTMLMHASLTASTMILQPLAISGTSLLVYGFASAAVMWAVVAAFAIANRGQLARQPLSRQVA
ncbi:MAG: CPBP family intramembrane glutamic endopeptidase [Candidatus Cryosericum sp.]